MAPYPSAGHFPSGSPQEDRALADELASLLHGDYGRNFYFLLGGYQRTLAGNGKCAHWPAIHDKSRVLFMCGRATSLDGPMIGIPVSIRDSDYFRESVRCSGQERLLSIRHLVRRPVAGGRPGAGKGHSLQQDGRLGLAGGYGRRFFMTEEEQAARIGRFQARERKQERLRHGTSLP